MPEDIGRKNEILNTIFIGIAIAYAPLRGEDSDLIKLAQSLNELYKNTSEKTFPAHILLLHTV